MTILKPLSLAFLALTILLGQASAQTRPEGGPRYVESLLDRAIELDETSKYAKTDWFRSLPEKLPVYRRRAVEEINRRTGLAYMDRFTIVMRFRDQNEDGARKYRGLHAQRLTVQTPVGETQRILFFLEYFLNGTADLQKKITHEFVHAIMRETMDRQSYLRIPKWVREGTAVYLAGQTDARVTHILSLRAESNPFSLVSDLTARHTGNDYARDALVFDHLDKKFGPEKLRAFFGLLVKERTPYRQALEKALSVDYATFRAQGLAHALARVRKEYRRGDGAYKEAFQLYRLRLFGPAIAAFGDIIEKHPSSYAASAASYYMAKCHYYKKELAQAKAAFLGHILVYSGRSGLVDDAKFYIGLCLFEQGNAAGCAETMGDLIRDYPYAFSVLPKAYYYLGMSRLSLGKREEALAAFDHCVTSFRKSSWARKAGEEAERVRQGGKQEGG